MGKIYKRGAIFTIIGLCLIFYCEYERKYIKESKYE